MSGDAVFVYLTRADWCAVTDAFEREVAVCYARCGATDERVLTWAAARDIDGFGVAPTGDEATNPSFLVSPAHERPVARVAEQRAGGAVRVVDRMRNQRGFEVRPGGAFGRTAVIVGQIPALPGEHTAAALRARFVAAVRAGCTSLGGFLVGPEARQMLRRGCRLTPYVDGDTLYDLREE
ncbi:MAG: hypothetical protein KAI24_07320 [Planctomycetes bacterium]|nr:hypothetical protein [Planctomycetota bacterium]